MTEKTVLLLGCLLVAGFALAAAAIHAPRLEARLADEASAALAAKGVSVEARAEGRRIVLRGEVADAETRRRAAAAVAQLAGVRGVVDQLRVAPGGTTGRPAAAPPSPDDAPTAAPVAADEALAAVEPDHQAELDRVIAGRRIDFRRYGDELTPEALVLVAEVADYLIATPEIAVEIAGYTDSRGDLAGNYEISERRAAAVRRGLVERGVAADRLTSIGRGPEGPVADNTTAAGRRANRRVELSVKRPES